jgi:hypothetical protein
MNISPVGGEWCRDGTVKCVREDVAEFEFELPARELGCEKEADAAAEANEDSAVGAIGSGATVLSMLSQ